MSKVRLELDEWRRGSKKKPRKSLNYLDQMGIELKGKSYKEFLKSKYWAVVRALVLKRDNYKCCNCGNSGLLEVHHETYRNHCNEHRHLRDLSTLCKFCHKEHHFSSQTKKFKNK